MCLSIKVHSPEAVLLEFTESGFECAITHNGTGYRCGYIKVGLTHPWYGREYDAVDVDVHGGLTFSKADVPCDAEGDDQDWWLGFDCGHFGDACDRSLMHVGDPRAFDRCGTVRSTEYVREQLVSLVAQAIDAVESSEGVLVCQS